jgi:hypothetical protein
LLAGRQERGGRRAAEQREKGLGAELVGRASQSGGPQPAGQGGNVLVGGNHRGRGQVSARERGRSGVLVPALDAGFPLRLLLPLPGSTRIGGQHCPAGRRSHLRGGLSRGSNQDVLLHGCRVVIVEPGSLVGDDAHAGQVDHPGLQRPGGQGQPSQCDCQVQHAASAPTGQRQQGSDLGVDVFRSTRVASRLLLFPATHQVTHRRQFQCAGPRREPAPGADHPGEFIVGQPAQPRGTCVFGQNSQRRPGWQRIGLSASCESKSGAPDAVAAPRPGYLRADRICCRLEALAERRAR